MLDQHLICEDTATEVDRECAVCGLAYTVTTDGPASCPRCSPRVERCCWCSRHAKLTFVDDDARAFCTAACEDAHAEDQRIYGRR